jgi:hypothetical protein
VLRARLFNKDAPVATGLHSINICQIRDCVVKGFGGIFLFVLKPEKGRKEVQAGALFQLGSKGFWCFNTP